MLTPEELDAVVRIVDRCTDIDEDLKLQLLDALSVLFADLETEFSLATTTQLIEALKQRGTEVVVGVAIRDLVPGKDKATFDWKGNLRYCMGLCADLNDRILQTLREDEKTFGD